ncbi:hypothetical protein PFISCL1PPCAC_28242 [Pristionchus fissidentatus]|uniref:Regulatory protein SIR2 homolog 7 n=1 Tax=Pristionchus fissidentatus TaxID=1538716 RepID=A0AAV5X1T0_9BILA|nr:hypothetical protein PFISCL1PPCAC_28242 [Pristionchus fissidentatus]
MSRRAQPRKNLTEDDEEPEITSGDEAEKEYEKHADEPTDSDSIIDEKVGQLVDLIKTCHTKLIYTGAGISTAANIPDYRGPGGVYTMAKKGIAVTCHDIVSQSPTTSHLVIKELYRHSYISHIVSQNCDGMHIRSGIPQNALSEIHGNMHIEVCSVCSDRQFLRTFDVTEDSGYRAHGTSRNCQCGAPLLDTIVHYGERGKARFPLNWEAAQEIVPMADLIICIGSSLQVLKDYKFLWPAPNSTAKIVIINLQWTPKDKDAALVIRGDCEKILTKIAEKLEIEIKHYCRDCDPILATRRNTRNGELLMKLTDCTCHIRPPRVSVALPNDELRKYSPGWWRVGVKAMTKEFSRLRRSNTKEDSGYDEQNRDPASKTPSPSGVVPAKRGRPRKRKVSSEEEAATRSGRRTSNSDDDEYAPQRHQQRLNPSTIRSTRSSGAAEEQPLVGNFRKKRHDAGRRKKGQFDDDEENPQETIAKIQQNTPGFIEDEIDVEGEDENEEVNVEEEEIDVDEAGEGRSNTQMNGIPAQHDDHIVFNDVIISSVAMEEMDDDNEMIFQPEEGSSPDEDDAFIDVVGDFEERKDDIVYDNMIHNDSAINDSMYNDRPEILNGSGGSLAMSLSQLNDPNQDTAGRQGSQNFDVFDFHEDSQHELIPPRMGFDAASPQSSTFISNGSHYKKKLNNRYQSACNGNPSSSNYYDATTNATSNGHIEKPQHPHSSTITTQQLTLTKEDQTASTSFTSPPRSKQFLRLHRIRKEPREGTVEFFLRQLNGGLGPSENTTSMGALYEKARQIVDPAEDETQFRACLISAARTFKGTDADPAPEPVKKKTKKGTKSKTEMTDFI